MQLSPFRWRELFEGTLAVQAMPMLETGRPECERLPIAMILLRMRFAAATWHAHFSKPAWPSSRV